MNKLFEINDYELLSKKVYHILKARIIKGDLAQGGKLFEAKKGVVVINVSIEDLQEVLRIRRVLEGLAASIAAEKISPKEITKLEEIIKKMSTNISKPKPDVAAYSELNAEFHNLILNACGNRRLMKICNDLSSSDHRFRIRSLRNNPGRLKYSLKEHQDIVGALKRKDADQAEKLSRIHIDNVLKNILENESKEKGEEEDAQN